MTVTANQRCRLQIQVVAEVIVIEVVVEATAEIAAKTAAEAAAEAAAEIAAEVLVEVTSRLGYHSQIQLIMPVIQAQQGLEEMSQHLS